MKPNSTNYLGAWGYVGLFILFSMPYIGTPACVLFAIFGQGAAKSFARALLIIGIAIVLLWFALIVAVLYFGLIDLSEFEYYIEDGGVQLLRHIPYLIG